MKNLDRVLVIVLALGVWALVLKPTSITANSEPYHHCSINGVAEGEADGWEVTIEKWRGVTVNCFH